MQDQYCIFKRDGVRVCKVHLLSKLETCLSWKAFPKVGPRDVFRVYPKHCNRTCNTSQASHVVHYV